MADRFARLRFAESVIFFKTVRQRRSDERTQFIQIRLIDPVCLQRMLDRLCDAFLRICKGSVEVK